MSAAAQQRQRPRRLDQADRAARTGAELDQVGHVLEPVFAGWRVASASATA